MTTDFDADALKELRNRWANMVAAGAKNRAAAVKGTKDTTSSTKKSSDSGKRSGAKSETKTWKKAKAENKYEKYSLKEEFSKEFDQWYNSKTEVQRGNDGGYFQIGTVSGPLQSVGVRESNIYWRKSKIQTILEDHPEITPDIIKKIPAIGEHPIIIMKSKTRDDSIVLIGDVQTANGNHVMMSMDLTPTPAGSLEAEFALITSAYGKTKESYQNMLESSEILFLAEKNRVNTLLTSLGVRFPSDQQAYNSAIGSISYNGKNVKISGKKIFESEESRATTDTSGKESYSRKTYEDYSTRAVIERALKTLDRDSAEYRALSEYKATLDSIDAERKAYRAATQAGDRTLMAQTQNRIDVLNGKLARMEKSANLSHIAAVKDVSKLNEDAAALRELWKLQTRETRGTVAQRSSAEAAAAELMKRHNIKRGKGELADLLSTFYTKMMKGINGQSYNREQMIDAARPAAEWIVDHVPEYGEVNTEVQQILDFIKGRRVY